MDKKKVGIIEEQQNDEEIEVVLEKTKHEKKNYKNNMSVILVVSVIVSFICGVLGSYLVVSNKNVLTNNVVKNVTQSELVETSIASSVDKVYNAVVTIVGYNNGVQSSSGTGFIYKTDNKKAYIMTNNHVISDCDKVEVIFSDNTTEEVNVLGKETYSDIAVLSMNIKDNITVAQTGDSTAVKLGDIVFTIGSPLGAGYSSTVTKGILSGKDRLVEVSYSGSGSDYYVKVLQTDAAINPGNSGGPLLNANGEVIGITSLKLVQDEVEGMGFAIPIEDALEYAKILEKGETIKRPYVGITMLDTTQTMYLRQYGISVPSDVNGVVVLEVESGSPADKAGLKKGDIITALGGNKTESVAEFRYELFKHEVGEKVEVKYVRNNKTSTVKITLGENS